MTGREPLWLLIAAAALWLTFWPMMTAHRHGMSPWPWILLPLLLGPLTGAVYLFARWREDVARR